MAKELTTQFLIEPGKRPHLGHRDPADVSAFPDREGAESQSLKDGAIINELQDRLYAERSRALLVVLQGIDTAGKDGTIRHVFSQTGPMGVVVTAFGKPSDQELAHDYLWRAHLAAPRRGFIGLFNRSHYEDVLVGRVRKLAPKHEIEARYHQINMFEKMLTENGTVILKFMLHISKKEQRQRLLDRLNEPKSRWKFNPEDLKARLMWEKYRAAYELVLHKCSTAWAPWHVIPSDHKWARNAAIAGIVRATLEQMNPQYPKPKWDPKDFKVS
jgi:PPK2 family polyphosphate:nucleotide phosphotransferase